jgi:hypothetical protein
MSAHCRRAIRRGSWISVWNSKPCLCESLEPRRMLATFNGSRVGDTIEISVSNFGLATRVIINGVSNTTTDAIITINANGGPDVISVSGMRRNTNVTVNGGDGNDLLQNTVSDLDDVFDGNFTFVGGAGTDSVMADNGTDTANDDDFRIEGDRIIKQVPGFPNPEPDIVLIRYSQIESLTYSDNNNGNFIRFANLRGPDHDLANVTILGNGGDDGINNVTSNNVGADIGSGGLYFDGGSGSDTAGLQDLNSQVGASYVVNSTAVGSVTTIDAVTSATNPGPLTLVSVNRLGVTASPHNDNFVVNSKLPFFGLGINGAGGDDTFTIGGGDIDSNGFDRSGDSFDPPDTNIGGGEGTDIVRFDDRLDAEGEVETYTFTGLTFGPDELLKGQAGIGFSGFEFPILDTADVVTALNVPNTVNFDRNASVNGSSVVNTTINGGALRSCLVNVGNGDLAGVFGAVAINFGAASGVINVNDQNSTGATSSYEINNSQVRKTSTGKTINYSSAAAIVLNASNVADAINVRGIPAGTSVTVNANGGNDNLFFGGGNVDANLLGPITLNAGSGTDFGGIDNHLDTTLESITLNAGSWIDNGLTYAFSGIEGTLNVSLGPGGTNLTINGTTANTNINGDAGDESVTIGGGDIDANLAATVAKGTFIDARGGHNTLRINDLNDTNLDVYIFKQTSGGLDQFDKRDGTNDYFVTWSGVEAVTLDASNAPASGVSASTILVNSIGTPLRINGNAGPDDVQIEDTFSPVTVNTGLGDIDSLSVNSDLDVIGATALIEQNDDIENLSLFDGGTVRVMPGAVLLATRNTPSGGSVTITGVLDLAGGAFLSRAGGPSLASFQALLTPGFNGGGWNGTSASGAINSSLAASSSLNDGVGYGVGSQVPPTIGSFTIGPNDMLVRYTLNGDSDLDLDVDLSDLGSLASHIGATSGSLWSQSNFDYDEDVDLADLGALATTFGMSLPGEFQTAAEPLSRRPIRGLLK